MRNAVKNNPILAFFAASAFCLAGCVDLASGVLNRPGRSAVTALSGVLQGSLLSSAGLLWLGVGLRWRRNETRRQRQALGTRPE